MEHGLSGARRCRRRRRAPPPPPRNPKRRAASSSTRSAPTTVRPSPSTSAFRASSASHCHLDEKRANNQFPAPRSCSRTSPCCARAVKAWGASSGPSPKTSTQQSSAPSSVNPVPAGSAREKSGASSGSQAIGLACCCLGGREKVRRLPRHLLVEQRRRRGAGAPRRARGTWRGEARPLPSGVVSAPRRRRGSPKPCWPKLDGGGDAYAPKGLWRLSGGFEPERSRAVPSAGDAKRLGARDMCSAPCNAFGGLLAVGWCVYSSSWRAARVLVCSKN